MTKAGNLALVLLAASMALGGCAPPPPEARMVDGAARMPSFTLKDARGGVFASTEFSGKVVLVDFWATWCAPCKKEMPGFQELQDRHGPRGFVVVGIALDEDAEQVTRFARELGVTYTLLLADSAIAAAWGGLEGLPTTFLVDRSGVVRKKVIGFEYPAEFEGALLALL